MLHLGDALLLEIGGDYPRSIRHSIFVLVSKVVLELLPSKWKQGIIHNIPVHCGIHVIVKAYKG